MGTDSVEEEARSPGSRAEEEHYKRDSDAPAGSEKTSAGVR